MRTKIAAASVAALLATAVLSVEAPVLPGSIVKADFEAPPPKGGTPSGGQKNSSNSGGAYVATSVACSAITLIGKAVYFGGVYQRQLTPNEALSTVFGCFVPGLGYVYTAFNPNTAADLYSAHIAWLWEQIPWVRERLWMERQSGGFTYPSLQQMLRDLRAAGVRV